jgi:hypothetical protein
MVRVAMSAWMIGLKSFIKWSINSVNYSLHLRTSDARQIYSILENNLSKGRKIGSFRGSGITPVSTNRK